MRSRFDMVRIAIALLVSSLACSPSTASITSSLIDDFSGPSSAANGFTRSQNGGAAVSGGAGVLPLGGGFAFVAEPPNDAHIFNGISLEVGGNLGQGTLFLSLIGADNQYFAVDVPLNDYVHDGYVWITFNQIDAEFGNEPNTIAAGLSAGIGIRLIELDFLATEFGGGGPLTIDNLEFRAAALPAPVARGQRPQRLGPRGHERGRSATRRGSSGILGLRDGMHAGFSLMRGRGLIPVRRLRRGPPGHCPVPASTGRPMRSSHR